MRRYVRVELQAQNLSSVEEEKDAGKWRATYMALVTVLADACDQAALGENTWVSVGKTRDGSSLNLTVHLPEGPISVFAPSLAGLSKQAEELL